MAQKFKVGGSVNHFAKGDGVVVKYDNDTSVAYPIRVSFKSEDYTFTSEGRLYEEEEVSLRLTGRPFNVGDRVVIGGKKGVIDTVLTVDKSDTPTPVRIVMGIDNIWITTDGRAWPGTPIIAEHDWEEETETVNKELDEAVKNSQAFAQYQNQEKEAFDVSPGFAKDWPIDNGIEDVTVSDAEGWSIAEMHGKSLSGQAESDILKKQHNYTRMALALTGFKVDNEAAALITETVKKVLELGGEFSLDTACEVEARVNQMYDDDNV